MFTTAEDGLVVYVAASDTVHHLNKTAGVIFGLCDGSRDAAAIADEVAVLFALERASARRDGRVPVRPGFAAADRLTPS